MDHLSKKLLTSKYLASQICGALLSHWCLMLLLLLTVIMIASPQMLSFGTANIGAIFSSSWLKLLSVSFFVWLLIAVCQTLTNIFSLRREEAGITWCQISILFAVGLWVVGFIIVFDLQSDKRFAAATGIAGTVVAWIFQDTLKGVVAFIHLRMNHLLRIGDWIKVPKFGVEGTVSHVTLTTVTIYNDDTTTSSLPTSVLHADHFINLQNMADGKTYGRRMMQTFVFDSSTIRKLGQADIDALRTDAELSPYLPAGELAEGALNATLYRIYLFHWLMRHGKVAQNPCLTVHWLEQRENGMPLQLYAFLTEGSFEAFELLQSQIIEHVLATYERFGLQIYQRQSSHKKEYITAMKTATGEGSKS